MNFVQKRASLGALASGLGAERLEGGREDHVLRDGRGADVLLGPVCYDNLNGNKSADQLNGGQAHRQVP